jgi:hypothetical protein
MTTVRHLTEEICVGLQIYVAGRSGSHLKSAFVLCDDYTELATKMYLVMCSPAWSDTRSNGRFKNYATVLGDLRSSIQASRQSDLGTISDLHDRMLARRARRNVFFHSTTLLDLSVTRRDTAEALVDLLDYCHILFSDWETVIASVADMETLSLLVRLDAAISRDGTLLAQLNELFEQQPKNRPGSRQKGAHLTVFPEDLHALMSIRWGGSNLKAALQRLLSGGGLSP